MPLKRARRFAVAQLQIAGNGVRLGDVVERHHHQPKKDHRREGGDPIEVRRENSVLIGGGRPAHQFDRAEVGGEEAQARNPCGHFAAGHEEVVGGVGVRLQIDADAEHHDEIDHDDQNVRVCKEISRPSPASHRASIEYGKIMGHPRALLAGCFCII